MTVTVALREITTSLPFRCGAAGCVAGSRFPHDVSRADPYGSTIVVRESTVLSGAMARIVADDFLPASGSMARA